MCDANNDFAVNINIVILGKMKAGRLKSAQAVVNIQDMYIEQIFTSHVTYNRCSGMAP